jgi:hypothetical protein
MLDGIFMVRYYVIMAVAMKIAIFWNVTLRSLVDTFPRMALLPYCVEHEDGTIRFL